jgi:hypothetical protein
MLAAAGRLNPVPRSIHYFTSGSRKCKYPLSHTINISLSLSFRALLVENRSRCLVIDLGSNSYVTYFPLMHAVAQLVGALCYKPEGLGIESR